MDPNQTHRGKTSADIWTFMKGEDSEAIQIRKNSRAIPIRQKIYHALNLWKIPGKIIKAVFKKKKK